MNEMADPIIDVLTPGTGGAETPGDCEMAGQADETNANVAFTAMANAMANASGLANLGYAAAAERRTSAADQLGSDSQRMWSIAMTSPTVMAAHGMRVANESGAGRTRVEANSPASSQTTGGT